MTRPVHLVACVGQKLPSPRVPATCISRIGSGRPEPMWRHRAAVGSSCRRCMALSPFPPDRALQRHARRYDGRRAPRMGRARQRPACRPDRPENPVVILAGRLYRDPIASWAGSRATVPMEGLGIGQQKAWLARQISEAREREASAAQLDLFRDVHWRGARQEV